jgi:uncharacterized protein (TIGR02246 family)
MRPKIIEKPTYERVYQIIRRWLKTVENCDPTEVANLYDKQGVLLGTVAENVKQGRSVIKTYFDSFLKKHPVGVLDSIVFQTVGHAHATVSGNYTFELDDKDGERVFVPARYTFVVDLQTRLILTHHSSSTPDGKTTVI